MLAGMFETIIEAGAAVPGALLAALVALGFAWRWRNWDSPYCAWAAVACAAVIVGAALYPYGWWLITNTAPADAIQLPWGLTDTERARFGFVVKLRAAVAAVPSAIYLVRGMFP
jgi:hypothetical protein